MRDSNQMEKFGFIMSNIWWMLIAMVWYTNILFRCIGSLDFGKSRAVLWTTLIGLVSAGICLELKRRRNGFSIAVNLAIPYGLYTAAAYISIRKNFILIILGIAGVLSVLYAAVILGRKIKNRRRIKQVILRRIRCVATGVQTTFAAAFMVIIISLGCNILFGSTLMQASVDPGDLEDAGGQAIEEHMQMVLRLQENVWRRLSVEERLDVLQVIANLEQIYLGLPNELNVGMANLEKDLLGYYRDGTHEIVLNMDSLLNDDAAELLNTLCHEAYHSYQHRLVDVYRDTEGSMRGLRLFKSAKDYFWEFSNYADASGDFCSYYEQDCESDAREYAELAVATYYEKIAQYLKDHPGF